MKRKGKPDLHLKGFRLWVHDREFPEAWDYFTGNWRIVSAELHTGHGWARVERSACVMTTDFASFLSEVEQEDDDAYRARWELELKNPLELEVAWTFRRTDAGLEVVFKLTANPAREWHSARLDVPEIEWQDFKAQLRKLVERYPVRDVATEGGP